MFFVKKPLPPLYFLRHYILFKCASDHTIFCVQIPYIYFQDEKEFKYIFKKMHTHKNGENSFKSLNTIVCTDMVAMTMASHQLFIYILSTDHYTPAYK